MIRILLIEDDDISRAFLAEALAASEAAVTASGGFTEALRHCSDNRFDLIVSDIRLGDGTLYELAPRFPAGTPVLATTAQLDAGVRARLAAVGVDSVLGKPATVNEIRRMVERMLARAVYRAESLVFDETHALKALGGNGAALRSMKSLFKLELPEMAGKIRHAFEGGDTDAIHALLHKLKASCGFLGANRLLEACMQLDQQPDPKRLECFMQTLDETLASL